MNKLIPITLLLVGITTQAPPTPADWWSDNGDTADAQDIDSGAQPETSTDDDLVKDAQGPGQPQNDAASGVPVIYDGYGNAYAYGMPLYLDSATNKNQNPRLISGREWELS